MDLHQLRCFLAAADELHFGRAAQRLHMLPSALGRHIRLLEEDLATPLFARTTRSVSLTEDGSALIVDARALIAQIEAIETRFRQKNRPKTTRRFRIGAMDSAAAGLLPQLMADVHARHPNIAIQVLEERSVRLLPKVLSGALDLAFVRPPEQLDRRLEYMPLLEESAVVALPEKHRLARRRSVSVRDIAREPLIVPDRRSRPHSHDLTVRLFEEARLTPTIAEVADEKRTIVNLVAARLGVAIVPRWTARMAPSGVRFVSLKIEGDTVGGRLPLAAVWLRGSRDPTRDAVIDVLEQQLENYVRSA